MRLEALMRPKSMALLAAVVLVIIYVASIGATGPWDPWETHYGEVARNIVVRHDPLDLWWQAGNGGPEATEERSFASKPALPYWAMALSMKIFGVGTSGDPGEMVNPPLPEIALRLPSLLAGLLTAFFSGVVGWRLSSPRAGVLTGVVLATMPMFAIVTRQALTDMFFVGPVVLAMGAWALAWLQPDRDLKTRGKGWKQIPWDRAYLAFFLFFIVAAVVPLIVVHQHAFDPLTWKHFGKSAAKSRGLRDIQVHMFGYWAIVVVVFALSLRWRRRSQAWMGVLYLAAGLSLIGKGLIGPGLIGAVVLGHIAVTGRWGLLRKCMLPTGALLFLLPAFPWHHAMILYRGDKWISEYILDNNLRRFATGEQKQAVGGFAFYLETLGLAALPWSAIFPLALWGGIKSFRQRLSKGEDEQSTSLLRFSVIWFVVTMLVLSYTSTKYYHYLLPALPPLAWVIGLTTVRSLGSRFVTGIGIVVGLLIGVGILGGVVRDAINSPASIVHLTTYLYTGPWLKGGPEPHYLLATCVPFVVGLGLWGLRRARWAVGAWILSGLLTTGYLLNDYLPAASENWSQRSMLQVYFNERGEDDRLVSWWFYYRGETYLSKGKVWVMKDPNKAELAELFAEYEGKGASLWFLTIDAHARRLKSNVPAGYRDSIEEKYRNFHYVMLRIHVP